MAYLSDAMDFCGFNESQQEGLLEAIQLANCNVDIKDAASASEALFLFNEKLQACFIQGIERQQTSDKIKDPQVREQILAKLSFFLEEIDEGKDVPIKLILGGNQNAVKERLEYGITSSTEEVYLLGSDRKLWPIHEYLVSMIVAERLAAVQDIDVIKAEMIVEKTFAEIFAKAIEMRDNRANYTDKEFADETNKARVEAVEHFTDLGLVWPTEADMMVKLSEACKEKYPDAVFKPVISAKDKVENGVSKRANTTDTVLKLWEDNEGFLAGKAASIVTEQPYTKAQEIQVRVALNGKPIEIKTMAKKANSDEINVSVLLAEVAKAFYVCKSLDLSKLDEIKTCEVR